MKSSARAKDRLLKSRELMERRLLAKSAKRAASRIGLRSFSKEGLSAIRDWRKSQASQALQAQGEHGSPDESVDLEQPWWMGCLTSDPALLNSEKRARCEMIMGLAPKGSPAPDWSAIQHRAEEIFEKAAARHGLSVRMHCSMRGSLETTLACQGRSAMSMPAYAYGRGGMPISLLADIALFDKRRAKRRAGRQPPTAWADAMGSFAKSAWELGASRDRLGAPRMDSWAQALASLRQAMIELGAKAAYRCPGFFAQFPSAMDSRDAMELIDRDGLDPLRQRWCMSTAAAAAAPSPDRSRSAWI